MTLIGQSYYSNEDIVPLVNSKTEAARRDHGNNVASKSGVGILVNAINRKFLLLIIVITLISVCVFVYEGEDINVDENAAPDRIEANVKPHSNETFFNISEMNEGDLEETLFNDKSVDQNDGPDVEETIVKTYSNETLSNISEMTESDVSETNDKFSKTLPTEEDTMILSHSSEPMLNISKMKERFNLAQQALIQTLRHDYGNEAYDKMFVASDSRSQGRYVFKSPSDEGTSWNRAKRKMMMKLLEVQIHQKTIPFIWATGGHSAAAGHGNFFDESYTANLHKAAFGFFESVGLYFIARNYAMGGTSSAPEIALCANEVFGQDIDALVWDFGMTDGRSTEKLFLYMYHGVARNKNRPIGLAYHAGGRYERFRRDVMALLEKDYTLPVFQSSEEVMNDVLANVPDSFSMSPEQIEIMPTFVRGFKCGNAIESGEPVCSSRKFNATLCVDRKARTSWHPGWKWHALMGNLAALFLMELVDDALADISTSNHDYFELFAKLKEEEDKDYEKSFYTPLPDSILNNFFDKEPVDNSTLRLLFQGQVYCHTARLPAEIRHKGILTLSDKTGFTTYDVGIELLEARGKPNEEYGMQLVYEQDSREDCPVTTNMDHKDFFYVSSSEDWQQLELPNDLELQEYGPRQVTTTKHGVIGMCLTLCAWGHCPSGVLTREEVVGGECEFRLNGNPVVAFKNMHDCDLFVGTGNNLFWMPNENGKFVIEAKVKKLGSYIRVSSFIVWTAPPDLSLNVANSSLTGYEADDELNRDLLVSSLPLSTNRAAALETMVKGFAQAKQQLTDRLLQEYGSDTFQKMFIEKVNDLSINRGSQLFRQAEKGKSGFRFKRKAMIKLLQVLVQFETQKPSEIFNMIPFVWATGGHSAAAGHGNLYDESYTAVMERSCKKIFAALGLNFTGRNYAMGGTKAAPEVALCTKEIFGSDFDVLSWDFGMTDGDAAENEVLYFYRASLSDNRPACIGFHTGGYMEKNRWQITQDLDDLGITALNSVESVMQAVLDNVPDSFGLSEDEIARMPPFVRNFRCSGQIESGEPYCKALKFNLTICPSRKYQTNWHPGWRWHACMGYLATFFLVDTFEAALVAVADATDPEKLLTQLITDEVSDYKQLTQEPIPEYLKKFLEPESLNEVIIEAIAREHNFCHTAKLPAEIRHLGILTESNLTGFTTFDKGMSQKDADSVENSDEFIRLVYDEAERMDCPVTTIMDYKDYFYLHAREQWKKLILPNDAELRAYGSDRIKLQGLIVICFPECPWGRCPKGDVSGRDHFGAGNFSITVNEVAVTKLTKLHECEILTNQNGILWEPNVDGRFEIKANVQEPDSFIRVSAFIIW